MFRTLVLACSLLALAAGSVRADDIKYSNEIAKTAIGWVIFSKAATGGTAADSLKVSVDWVEVAKEDVGGITMLVYHSAGPFTTKVLTAYMGEDEIQRRLFVPGRIDSINFASADSVSSAAPVYFRGYVGGTDD